MRTVVFLTIILFSSQVISAQNKPVSPKPVKGPFIVFVQKSHDFGTIDEGIKASFDFEFTNTGDSDLLLYNVLASCGCTVPTWPKKPVKPGEKGKITVVYNSTNRGGQTFHNSCTVSTNMLQDNVMVIYIKGQVAPKRTPETQPISPEKANQH
jgi:hypothetical protein